MANWSVFKFGGNSLKDMDSLKKAIELVSDFANDPLLIVVSAMGKTTNSLESYLEAKIIGDMILAGEATACGMHTEVYWSGAFSSGSGPGSFSGGFSSLFQGVFPCLSKQDASKQ